MKLEIFGGKKEPEDVLRVKLALDAFANPCPTGFRFRKPRRVRSN